MPSASPSSSSMAPQEHQVCKYDIFVSFRGEDTRYGFLSHLSAALHRKKILTFIDDKIEKGEKIVGALFEAIKDSKLLVIIFSENFASSTWCLEEVSEIIRCQDRMGQEVLPVFYHVDPSHIRKLTGSFAEAFARHEVKYEKEEVEKWRSALTQAANISGWHQASATSSENEIVEDIVGAVMKKLNKKSSIDIEGLVGMDSHIERVESLLCIGMADVYTRTVGIWGMGGIGKTTVAEVIFQQISNQFEGCCFLANVREEWEKYGPAHLQGKLLSAILYDENLKNVGPNTGRNIFVKDRLHRSKVLIVLDDVDNVEQLESLVGGSNCFGLGSRLIITTRNKQVLHGRVDEIYEVKALSGPDALQLFNQYAFKGNHPTEYFEELSGKLAKYANGNPLALKVLGAALLCKSKGVWQSALNKLEKTPLDEIQEKLRISYDGLGKEEKRIFLDIACFFKGDNKDEVTRLLDGCGFHTQFELSILVDKSLVAIEGNKILMHDLLQQMGRAIVFDESQHPGKRSRLWIPKEAYDVLRKSKGTDAVEGIILDLAGLNDDHFPAKTFARMKKLRVLKVNDSNRHSYLKHVCQVNLFQGLDCLPEELRCLWWYGYPLKSLPSKFDPVNLVDLDLSYSAIVKPWKGVQDLPNLKIINLSYCKHLIKTPDFSEAPNLESIILEGCTGLLKLHPSIGALDNLTELNLRDCEKVRNFPGSIHLNSLKYLSISCWSDQSAIEELKKSIKNLTGLDGLHLEYCEGLKSLPSSICQLKCLEELSLFGCSNLETFPEILDNMDALWKLDLVGTAIKELPSSIHSLSGLSKLYLSDCENLVGLPSSLSCLKSLRVLDLGNCSKLESFFCCSSTCPNSSCLCNLTSLESLRLCGTNIESVPACIEKLYHLKHLFLDNCKRLQSIVDVPLGIERIDAYGCTSLKTMNFSSIPFGSSKQAIDWSLNFCNCLELDQWSILEAIFERLEFLKTESGSQSCQVDDDQVDQVSLSDFNSLSHSRVSVLAPGSEIPGWFSDRSVGSSITIKVHPNLFDGNFMTFDMCAILECEGTSGYPFCINCECILETEFCEHSFDALLSFGYFEVNIERSLTTESGHTFISHAYIYKWPNNNYCPTHASFHFEEVDQRAKIKECGINLYYARDKESPYTRMKRCRDEEDNSFPVIQPSSHEDFVTSHRDSGKPMEESPRTRMKRCRDYSFAEQPSTEQTVQPSSPALLMSMGTCPAPAPMMGYMASLQGVISMDRNTVSSAGTQVCHSSEEEPPSKRLQYFEWL